MALDIAKYAEREKESLGSKGSGPYAKFRLGEEFSSDDIIGNFNLMVNYENETDKLFDTVEKYFNFIRKENQDNIEKYNEVKEVKLNNKLIMVVGTSGIGKSTFVDSFIKLLNDGRGMLQFTSEINYFLKIGNKFGDLVTLDKSLIMKDSLRGGVLFLDDLQFAFYPNTEDSKKKERVDRPETFLKNLNDKATNSVIISTIDVYGLSWLLKNSPDIYHLFSENLIWLDGLNDKNLKILLRDRLNHFCLDGNNYPIETFFESSAVQELINLSLKKPKYLEKSNYFINKGNPRYFVRLVDRCIIKAVEIGKNKITSNIVKEVCTESKDLDEKTNFHESHQIIIESLLTRPRMNRKQIRLFTRLEQSTVTKRVNELVKLKYLVEEVGIKSSGSKVKYYRLADCIRLSEELEIKYELLQRMETFSDK